MDIQKTFYKIGEFVSWYKNGNLILSPEFQRRSVWKTGTKSFLIDTIVKGLPIPIIFLRDREIDLTNFELNKEVIDGQQRLRTVLAYIEPSLLSDFNPERDDFTVQSTHNKELAGKQFKELSQDLQRRILEYQFNVHILPSYVDDRDVIQIFRRMNSTNYNLNAQELRNAEFFGEFKTSIYEIAAEQFHRWRGWKTFTEDDIARMLEVELTSELVLLILRGEIIGKSKSAIKGVYQKYDGQYPQRAEVENRFSIVMDTIDDKLGSNMRDLPLNRRTLIYSLFACFYDVLFGLNSTLDEKMQPNSLSPDQIAWIKLAGERIQNKTAPEEVLNATTRRTTNVSERKILFDYLRKAK